MPVRRVLADLLEERLQNPHRQVIRAVVVVAVAREVTFDLKVNRDAGVVADGLHLGVLNRGQRIHHVREARDTGRKRTAHVGVDQRHFRRFVEILVVHVVNEVQRVHVHARKPIHHALV